jgi:predicted amidophosphoribosyltransferase
VNEIAGELGRLLNVPVFDDLIAKLAGAAGGQQLKDLATKEEKIAALQGRLMLNQSIANEGCWNALLVDDLFHTGATMEAACAVLRPYSKIGHIYVAALTWR